LDLGENHYRKSIIIVNMKSIIEKFQIVLSLLTISFRPSMSSPDYEENKKNEKNIFFC